MPVPAGSGLAESLDRLITLEPSLDGASRRDLDRGTLVRLYRAARRRVGGPLAEAAAGALLRRLPPRGRLLLTTGLVARGIPHGETDGPSGAVALARAVILGRGAHVVLVTEAKAMPVLRAAAEALAASEGDGLRWRRGLEIQAFPTNLDAAKDAARRLWADLAPAALVSVEKLGPNARGVIHNMAGQDVTTSQARSDFFFPQARRARVLTVGIGDRGNEMGLGGLLPRASRCACPCRGSIACVIPADVPVVAFSSNWGAYAVAGALAVHLADPRLVHCPRSEARMLRRMVRAGAVDGITRSPTPTVDGGGLALQAAVVGLLGALVGRDSSP
jgi:hypothetical protein